MNLSVLIPSYIIQVLNFAYAASTSTNNKKLGKPERSTSVLARKLWQDTMVRWAVGGGGGGADDVLGIRIHLPPIVHTLTLGSLQLIGKWATHVQPLSDSQWQALDKRDPAEKSYGSDFSPVKSYALPKSYGPAEILRPWFQPCRNLMALLKFYGPDFTLLKCYGGAFSSAKTPQPY